MIATAAWTSPGSKGEFPAHTPTELACLAGIAVPTASGHLLKLGRGGWSAWLRKGVTLLPHRLTEVARMLEGIMVVAAEPAAAITRATPRIDAALRGARTCHDHLAGELGVAITDALVALVAVELSDEGATVTAVGRALFSHAAFPPNGGP